MPRLSEILQEEGLRVASNEGFEVIVLEATFDGKKVPSLGPFKSPTEWAAFRDLRETYDKKFPNQRPNLYKYRYWQSVGDGAILGEDPDGGDLKLKVQVRKVYTPSGRDLGRLVAR
jgi:hypothetical protein